MKCSKCGRELGKKEKVCPDCGTKRPGYFNFIQRREIRAAETAQLIEKSFVHLDDVKSDNAVSQVKVQYLGEVKKIITSTIIRLCICVAVMCACIIAIAIKQYTDLMDSVKETGAIIMLLAAFLLIFGAGSVLADGAFYLSKIIKLRAEKLGVMKISYGKDPIAVYDDKLYTVSPACNCPDCEEPSAMHIEQVEDIIVAVCNVNRDHLHRISKADILNGVMEFEKTRSGKEYTPVDKEVAAPEEAQENIDATPEDGTEENAQDNTDKSDN